MQMEFFHTRPELKPYIKSICMMSYGSSEFSGQSAQDIRPFRVLPDTCVELFISCNGKPIARLEGHGSRMSFASFRMRSFMDVQMYADSSSMAICFYPGAAYKFFRQSMRELSDSATEISHLWDRLAGEMEEKLAETPGGQAKADMLQDHLFNELMRHGQTGGQIAHSLQLVERMGGQISVRELARESCMSERQLNRRFLHCLGISPKEYATMSRFIHSLSHIRRHASASLTEIAYASGYYDQSHFNHEYRVFAGMTPGELLSRNDIICCSDIIY